MKRKAPRLKLVWSAPPPERLALVGLERHQHVNTWPALARKRKSARAAERHLAKLRDLDRRIDAAKVADADDARAALLLAYYDCNLRSAGINHGSEQLQRAADFVRKVLDWLDVPPGDGPGDGPKLVG